MSNIVQMPTTQFRDNSQKAVRFDKLYPGSLFRIVAEPSRGILKSTDKRVYEKDLVGFFSVETTNRDHAIVLMPYDKVMPVVRVARHNAAATAKAA